MRCRICNKDIPDDSIYCPHCHANVDVLENQSNKETNPLKFIIIILLLIVIILVLIIIINKNTIPAVLHIEEESSDTPSGTRTIMIYMAGSNLESNTGLASQDLAGLDSNTFDLENNHLLVYTGGSIRWHNTYVSNKENAIYELKKDFGLVKIETLSRYNMGDPDTLTEFLNYGYNKYETDSYNLIIWNHGGAINGAVYDELTGDHLDLQEFAIALNNSPFNANNKLDTVLFRTCLNGTYEMANIFKDYANYLIASEEATQGISKTSTLGFLNTITSEDTSITYGTKFIDAYANTLSKFTAYQEDNKVLDPMYSIFDLSYVDQINKAFDEYILSINFKDNYGDIVRLRNKLFQFGYVYYDDAMYDTIDMYTLIEKLSPFSSTSPNELLKLLDSAIVYNWTSIPESKGIAIYFPYNGSQKEQVKNLNAYSKLEYAKVYLKFIQEFRNKLVSKDSTSYRLDGLNHNEIKYDSNTRTMSLSLTSDQVKDYLNSKYILIKKNSNNSRYELVYTSDNITEPTSTNKTLKATIQANTIALDYYSNGSIKTTNMPIEEKKYDNLSILSSKINLTALFANTNHIYPAIINYDLQSNKPVIGTVYYKDSTSTASSQLIELDAYDSMSITMNEYNVNNNKLIQDSTETKKTINLSKKYEFKYTPINDNYYGLFIVTDIYGHEYYTNPIQIK